jgi:hypothetical protein
MKKELTISTQIAYAMGVMGYDYNPAVIYDTVRQLHRCYKPKQLNAMVNCCEDEETPTLGEAINTILIDTYSAETI